MVTSRQTVCERIHAYLVEFAQVDPALLDDPALRLDQVGGLDSLGEVELLIQIEDYFDIVIDDSVVLRDMTMDRAVAYLEGLVAARAQSAVAEPSVFSGA